jgi:precorrin-6B methylase 2
MLYKVLLFSLSGVTGTGAAFTVFYLSNVDHTKNESKLRVKFFKALQIVQKCHNFNSIFIGGSAPFVNALVLHL